MYWLDLIPLAAGILCLVAGILIFSGRTRWGKRNYQIGASVVTNELVGVLLFVLGILLILFFLIPKLEPRFLSPGMAG